MINENLLPNPFKQGGSHLDHVLAAVERELEQYNEPLPAFLDRNFLERLHGSVERADPAHHSRGRRIVNLLKMQMGREP